MPTPRTQGRHHRFNLPEYEDYKELIRDEARNAVELVNEPWDIKGPFAVILAFTIARNKWHTSGDGDNYEKGVLDGCKRVIWYDDRIRYIPMMTRRFIKGYEGSISVQVTSLAK